MQELSAKARAGISTRAIFCAVIVGTAALAGSAVWLWRFSLPMVGKAKADDIAPRNDPYTLADAVLAYIQRYGRPPRSMTECYVAITQETQLPAPNEYGQLMLYLPYGGPVPVSRASVEKCVLEFPSQPDSLALIDDVLVTRGDGRKTYLLYLAAAPEEILTEVNSQLYVRWKSLVAHEPTGLPWLDQNTDANKSEGK
jgi:hypothetical protein